MIELENVFSEEDVLSKTFYATENSGGFDFISLEDYVLKPKEVKLFSTGLKIKSFCCENDEEVPFILITSRSGTALKKIVVLNAPAVIDADYPNEIKIMLMNLGETDYNINKGDRIAQGIVMTSNRKNNIKIKNNQRKGGFGSTGTQS